MKKSLFDELKQQIHDAKLEKDWYRVDQLKYRLKKLRKKVKGCV